MQNLVAIDEVISINEDFNLTPIHAIKIAFWDLNGAQYQRHLSHRE